MIVLYNNYNTNVISTNKLNAQYTFYTYFLLF